ncbi:hypothetical protein CRE_30536 [Caenorhabditis remanei]|uniref:Sdz-33 F-box domain-containing protein n=1 Tax=Caenorhabditis remanei TaxID=31234 RepID=E3NKN0_CAERE|nr:hypothetical protein CRE_30536 [Caenorhabditis remanei]
MTFPVFSAINTETSDVSTIKEAPEVTPRSLMGQVKKLYDPAVGENSGCVNRLVDIYLENASLTNSDLNVFLRHWLSGGCPRLKLFCARTGSVDILQVLAGLLRNAVFVEGRGDYTSPFAYRRTLTSGFDIRRADGVTATVCKQGNGTLVIAVWPETTYNYN